MSEPITDYGKIIAQLAGETDPARRAQLGRMLANRLEHAFGQSVDTAQAVRWETEEWLRQRMGETNDLISQLNQNQQTVKGEIAGGFDALQQALAAFRTNQEAAVSELRRDFHDRLNAVGERLSDFKITLDEHTDTIAALLELGKQWERRFEMLTRRVDQHDTLLADHGGRIAVLESYAAAVPPEERQRVIAMVEESERRYQDIQSQLAALLANRQT